MYEENDRDIQKNSKTVRIGLPKGNIYIKSRKLVEKFTGKSIGEGVLKTEYKNYRFYFLKHRDIPLLVEDGRLDYGITSDEWIEETSACIVRIRELNWCDTKIALIKEDGYGGDILNCVTEFENIAKKYFGSNVHIDRISGSSEALVPEMYNCCIDCVESGNTLKRNGLAIDKIILNSKVVLIGKTKSTLEIDKLLEYMYN